MSQPAEQHHSGRLDAVLVGGFAWTAGAKWLTQGITWVSVIVSARLLSPADFGFVGMAGFFFAVANVLAEFGMGAAVLQMRELQRRELSQIASSSLLFSTALFGFSVLIAPWIAAFFHSEGLKLLIIVNSLGFFITAVQAVPQGLLQRDLDYRRLSIAEALQAVLQAVVTIVAAWAGLGYWALVAGPFAGKIAATLIALYWKPVGLAWPRWKDIAAPLRFGVEVSMTRLAGTAYTQADGIIVGRVLGEAALGAYGLAMSLASAPADKIGMLIMRITGPLFARIQDDLPLVRRYFFLVSEILALTIFPLVFGMMLVAPEIVNGILGPKWQVAIIPMQWLALSMLVRTLNFLVTQVLTSLRLTTFSMWMSILGFVMMPVSFYLAAQWSVGAVAASWVVLSPLTILPLAVKMFRATGCRLRDYLAVLAPFFAASLAMIGVVMALRLGWLLPHNVRPLWSLAAQVACGGLVYIGILLSFHRQRIMQYVSALSRMRQDRDAMVLAKA